MLKGYKYRIFPTETQKDQLQRYFGVNRLVFNLGLETKTTAYASNKKSISKYDLIKLERQMTNKAQKPALRKTPVISSCDCLVGFLSGEKVNKSTIDFEVEAIVKIQPTFKKYGLLNESKSQIVDGRKGYLSRFAYCPYCGEKVNWKQVLSNCL